MSGANNTYPSILNCTQISAELLQCGPDKYTIGDHLDKVDSTQFFIDMGIVGALVLMAGLMSGLTMGLMSMDILNLKILVNGPESKEKKAAGRILPLVERHHWLLVTLLLSNAACAEALPIFLDRLVHPAIAIVLSVTLVLLFGEIIPQAVCTRYGLSIGASLSWFVWIMLVLLAPISWPIAKLLDFLLGKETGTFFRRAELKELVHLHAEDEMGAEGEGLTIDEVRIIKGAIDMKEKTVAQAYTSIDKVFALDVNSTLNREVLEKIVESGHDRIPVYHQTRDHFIGMILAKDLILVDPNAQTPVRTIKMYRVPMVGADMHLYDMLHQFQSGRSHMSIVLNADNHITPEGIITLEDVMEELLQEEIYDEDDLRRGAAKDTDHGYGSISHDMKVAKAFIPRKYSIAAQEAQGAARKYSMMLQPGANGSFSTNVPRDLRRRPTVAISNPSGPLPPLAPYPAFNSAYNPGSAHVVNISPAPRRMPPALRNSDMPPALRNNVTINAPSDNNNNNSEHAPLLPPGGKGEK